MATQSCDCGSSVSLVLQTLMGAENPQRRLLRVRKKADILAYAKSVSKIGAEQIRKSKLLLAENATIAKRLCRILGRTTPPREEERWPNELVVENVKGLSLPFCLKLLCKSDGTYLLKSEGEPWLKKFTSLYEAIDFGRLLSQFGSLRLVAFTEEGKTVMDITL